MAAAAAAAGTRAAAAAARPGAHVQVQYASRARFLPSRPAVERWVGGAVAGGVRQRSAGARPGTAAAAAPAPGGAGVAGGAEAGPPAVRAGTAAEAGASEPFEPPEPGITVRIVGREEGRRLNERFRGVPRPTNVLSFPFETPPGAPASALLGDVVLCAPVVNREARAQGKPAGDHWAHLVVHGVLHLLGFDHDTPAAARRMEGLERRVLAEMAVPDPYAQEVGGERE